MSITFGFVFLTPFNPTIPWHPLIQISSQVPGDGFKVHKIAEPCPGALPHLVLAAARLAEVCHGAQLRVDGPAAEPAPVQVNDSLLCVRLVLKLDVDVAHKMVAQIVTDIHLLNLAILVLALYEHLLKEVVVVFLHLLISHRLTDVTSVRGLGRVLGVDVEVLEHQSLREGGFVVDPAASVSVATSSNFEIETAVDFVFFLNMYMYRIKSIINLVDRDTGTAANAYLGMCYSVHCNITYVPFQRLRLNTQP